MTTPSMRGRVLVVEDEAYVRDSLVEILRARGFDVSASASVDEALERLARAPVDAVLSDLKMPKQDGLELVRRMQALSPDVPILILTGHGTVASAVECLRAGATDYILKPVEPDALELRPGARSRGARSGARFATAQRRRRAGGSETAIGDSALKRVAMVQAAWPIDSACVSRRVRHRQGAAGAGAGCRARLRPAVVVNCAAVPLEMRGASLRHRKGSFTGAQSDRDGASSSPIAARCCSTRWARCPRPVSRRCARPDGESERPGDERCDARRRARGARRPTANLDAEAAGRFQPTPSIG
jgi:CheY-like chemotaxis protein